MKGAGNPVKMYIATKTPRRRRRGNGGSLHMKEQIKAFLDRYKKEIMDTADQLRSRPMREETEELFALFETTGNRLQYEDVYFERRKYLAAFSMACYLEHRPQDIQKLEEVIRGICSERCWALPAHVNRKEDANWKVTVDLFASETGQALADHHQSKGRSESGDSGFGQRKCQEKDF